MNFTYNNQELKGKTIVIIEDDVPSIKYYETLLTNSGATIRIFTNGKDFVNYLETTTDNIDLLLVDFLIPHINGIDCVRIFRKERKSVPALMMTAYFSEQTRYEAFIAGCNEYVLKPVFPEKLYCLLEKYIKHEISFSAIN